MPKFLSFRPPSPKDLKENPVKAVWESFQSLDNFTKAFLIIVLLFILTTPFIVNNPQIFVPRAQQPEPLGATTRSNVSFLATYYNDVKDKLIAGDGVLISIARQQGNPDTPITADKVNNAVSVLNEIPTSAGMRKSLIFSSITDIRNFIGSVPADVEIAYNSEGALTPASERVDFYTTVKEGADLVHAAGKKFAFAPLRGDFDRMQENGELARILPLLDGSGYQGQLLYLDVGEDETVRIAKEKYNYVKSISPNTNFQFQMWVGRETTDQIISTFNKMQGYMDTAVIGGATAQDIITIIDGLNLSLPPTATPTSIPGTTPSPASGQFPIGVGLRTSELEWWNQRALSTDQVIGVPPSLTPVSSARGVRMMFTIASDPASSMDTAKTNGWMVSANIEDPNVDTVIGGGISSGSDTNPEGSTIIGQIEQYKMAKDRGLTFIFGPTGRMLENDWDYTYKGQDHALLRNADIMIYQTQRYQDYSSMTVAEYATTVKDLIGNIRPYLAKKQVWVQVSANPPANRCTTAAKVIQYIDSIMDGSANSPDAIHIFVSANYDNGADQFGKGNCLSQGQPTRVEVMKQVVDHYRSGAIISPSPTTILTLTPSAPTPTPTQAPIPTPIPTSIPTSTPTPRPTSTPTPTAVPTPTPVLSTDTIPPTVSITSPINGSIVPTNILVTIIASPSDNVGITKVEFYVSNSTRPKCTDTVPPYNCLWKVPGKTGAVYVIAAQAFDLANNSALNTVTVSTQRGFFNFFNFFNFFR